MKQSGDGTDAAWAASVYYVQIDVRCPLERAWQTMLDYESWNPSFVDAQVTQITGEPRSEGGVVLIKKSVVDVNGAPLPEAYTDSAFYARTVKVVPQRHFVWYLYPKEGDAMRNFVDFELSETPSGVAFNINYYAQDRISPEALIKHRKESEAALRSVAAAFKNYCEAHA